MTEKYRPTITIELGLLAAAKPSLSELRRRARNRSELISAGQQDLAFLVESDFPEVSPLRVVEGAYVIEGAVPRLPQGRLDAPASPPPSNRDDSADEQAIKAVLEAVALNAELLCEVAE